MEGRLGISPRVVSFSAPRESILVNVFLLRNHFWIRIFVAQPKTSQKQKHAFTADPSFVHTTLCATRSVQDCAPLSVPDAEEELARLEGILVSASKLEASGEQNALGSKQHF